MRPFAPRPCSRTDLPRPALISGAFLEKDPVNGWRNFYYLLIALFTISTLGFVVGYNPPPMPSQHKRTTSELLHDLDIVGIGLFAAGFALVLVGLNWGGSAYACEFSHPLSQLVAPLNNPEHRGISSSYLHLGCWFHLHSGHACVG